MRNLLVKNPLVYPTTITAATDDMSPSFESVNTSIEQLADRTDYLMFSPRGTNASFSNSGTTPPTTSWNYIPGCTCNVSLIPGQLLIITATLNTVFVDTNTLNNQQNPILLSALINDSTQEVNPGGRTLTLGTDAGSDYQYETGTVHFIYTAIHPGTHTIKFIQRRWISGSNYIKNGYCTMVVR